MVVVLVVHYNTNLLQFTHILIRNVINSNTPNFENNNYLY
jgi:hypothetical protein